MSDRGSLRIYKEFIGYDTGRSEELILRERREDKEYSKLGRTFYDVFVMKEVQCRKNWGKDEGDTRRSLQRACETEGVRTYTTSPVRWTLHVWTSRRTLVFRRSLGDLREKTCLNHNSVTIRQEGPDLRRALGSGRTTGVVTRSRPWHVPTYVLLEYLVSQRTEEGGIESGGDGPRRRETVPTLDSDGVSTRPGHLSGWDRSERDFVSPVDWFDIVRFPTVILPCLGREGHRSGSRYDEVNTQIRHDRGDWRTRDRLCRSEGCSCNRGTVGGPRGLVLLVT